MISFLDYKVDGKIDWEACRAAQVSVGESCYCCYRYLLSGNGRRRLCRDCEGLDYNRGEVTSSLCVRCPRCRHQSRIAESELYDLYEEGEHAVYCDSCNHKYTVSTSISYSFQSPALLLDGAEGGK